MKNNLNTNTLFNKIAELLQKARQSVVRTINQTMVYTYFEIGRMIVEDEQSGSKRAEYGKEILKGLSKKLTKEFGKGFSERNLENMRSFFIIYSASIPQTVSAKSINQSNINISAVTLRKSNAITKYETASRKSEMPEFNLSWSHYLKLMRIEDESERRFYEIESFNNNWSLRELQRQFDSSLYQRLILSADKKKIKELSYKGQVIEKAIDIVKDPYVLEFLDLPEKTQYSETDLEQQLIDKLEHFLLELGKGFTFVGRQVRITLDEKHFRIDLVFYNRLLRCFVLLDLKIGELTHQDIGQMQMYVNYYDRLVKLPEENKTVGIILCRDKSEALVEITLPEDNDRIFASRYKTVLPNKTELKKLLSEK